MKASRLAAYIVCVGVGGAWLASAAGIVKPSRPARSTPAQSRNTGIDTLAADVHAQSLRLRERLSNAPSPQGSDRNPFRFSQREVAAAAAPRPVTPSEMLPIEAPVTEDLEPSLDLIGIAENRETNGVVRTAMLTNGEQLLMVTAGQRMLSRYDVVTVSADAVELKDISTGAIRRLVLR